MRGATKRLLPWSQSYVLGLGTLDNNWSLHQLGEGQQDVCKFYEVNISVIQGSCRLEKVLSFKFPLEKPNFLVSTWKSLESHQNSFKSLDFVQNDITLFINVLRHKKSKVMYKECWVCLITVIDITMCQRPWRMHYRLNLFYLLWKSINCKFLMFIMLFRSYN